MLKDKLAEIDQKKTPNNGIAPSFLSEPATNSPAESKPTEPPLPQTQESFSPPITNEKPILQERLLSGEQAVTAEAEASIEHKSIEKALEAPPDKPIQAWSLEAPDFDWNNFVLSLDIDGIVKGLAYQLVLESINGHRLQLVLANDQKHLLNDTRKKKLEALLSSALAQTVVIEITLGTVSQQTPQQLAAEIHQQKMQNALASVYADPLVQALTRDFGATVDDESLTLNE